LPIGPIFHRPKELPIGPGILGPEEWETYKRKEELKRPIWKRKLGGVFTGLMGLEPSDYDPVERDANLLTQMGTSGIGLLKAGLPFSVIMKGKPIYHGSPISNIEIFDPSLYNKGDVLGWMTHGAEDFDRARTFSKKNFYGLEAKGRVYPIAPEAKNTLDLVDPDIKDLRTALELLPDYKRRALLSEAEEFSIKGPGYGEISKLHYPILPKDKESLFKIYLADKLRLTPTMTEDMPFDAIRYRDLGHKSWAIPERTPIINVETGKEMSPLTSSRPSELFDKLIGLPIGPSVSSSINPSKSPFKFNIGDTVEIPDLGFTDTIKNEAELQLLKDIYNQYYTVNIIKKAK